MKGEMVLLKSELSEAELAEIEARLRQGVRIVPFRDSQYEVKRHKAEQGEGYLLTPAKPQT